MSWLRLVHVKQEFVLTGRTCISVMKSFAVLPVWLRTGLGDGVVGVITYRSR